ncbi:hypothetical protein DRQ53_08100 [bacterium]|nr:MAG: hypothetical protein DRQ53_08100 [bacterium]
MAIKTVVQGTLPAVSLQYLQFKRIAISTQDAAPYRVAVSAKVRSYGLVDGVRVYDKDERDISIADIDAFIEGLPAVDQATAAAGMIKLQEALGTLAEFSLGIGFVEYE